eukprot:Blabericola_migrator_1__8394@NODE_436_length_8493_cov_87_644434_g342_i0_p1_GENE_NODE_436_length_8493_cov_87_644434_g342_i0NODE_436_length_8493_cov_87_644434_g342_i0_p1_ORF_typecomplete_len754_score127_42DUF21/PF01595_20/6_3e38CBS/PF00571_28/5CBS/PF00571_28/0_4_NODE_436_length_8493_cov_87_644434_g342_i036605921
MILRRAFLVLLFGGCVLETYGNQLRRFDKEDGWPSLELIEKVATQTIEETTTSTTKSSYDHDTLIYKARLFDWRFSRGMNETIYNVIIAIVLIIIAGFASGMTVGLLSIDNIQLKILQEEGTPEQRRQAHQLERVLSNHHLLLVTLLLANSICMEALPIFLNKTVPEWAAVALSVTAILAFGEVLPQALCTGKWQIPIVMRSLPIIDALIFLLYGLAWPIAKVLDVILGHNAQTYYARSHLKALIRLHQKERRAGVEDKHHRSEKVEGDTGSEMSSALGADEVIIIEGALDLATKMVSDIMVPIEDVYMLEWDTRLTLEVRKELLEKGHSRVPVYKTHRDNVKGLLLVKTIICLDVNEAAPKVGDVLEKRSRAPLFCLPSLQLYDLLNEFQRGRHMAFVTEAPEFHLKYWNTSECDLPSFSSPTQRLLGIATLEDVIEELIQEEIYDEFDHYQSTAMLPRPQAAPGFSGDSSEVPSKLSMPERLTLTGPTALMAPIDVFTTLPPPKVSRDNQEAEVIVKTKRMRDIVKPVREVPSNKHAGLVGPDFSDLSRRLIEDDPPLFPVGSSTTTDFGSLKRTSNSKLGGAAQATTKRLTKGRAFIVKRGEGKPTSTSVSNFTVATGAGESYASSQQPRMIAGQPSSHVEVSQPLLSLGAEVDGIPKRDEHRFRRYHSSADPFEPRSVRNLVGIAAARQNTIRTKTLTKLCAIKSAGREFVRSPTAKTEVSNMGEDDEMSIVVQGTSSQTPPPGVVYGN